MGARQPIFRPLPACLTARRRLVPGWASTGGRARRASPLRCQEVVGEADDVAPRIGNLHDPAGAELPGRLHREDPPGRSALLLPPARRAPRTTPGANDGAARARGSGRGAGATPAPRRRGGSRRRPPGGEGELLRSAHVHHWSPRSATVVLVECLRRLVDTHKLLGLRKYHATMTATQSTSMMAIPPIIKTSPKDAATNGALVQPLLCRAIQAKPIAAYPMTRTMRTVHAPRSSPLAKSHTTPRNITRDATTATTSINFNAGSSPPPPNRGRCRRSRAARSGGRDFTRYHTSVSVHPS